MIHFERSASIAFSVDALSSFKKSRNLNIFPIYILCLPPAMFPKYNEYDFLTSNFSILSFKSNQLDMKLEILLRLVYNCTIQPTIQISLNRKPGFECQSHQKNGWLLLCIIYLNLDLMNHSCTNSTFTKHLLQKSFNKFVLQFINFNN